MFRDVRAHVCACVYVYMCACLDPGRDTKERRSPRPRRRGGWVLPLRLRSSTDSRPPRTVSGGGWQRFTSPTTRDVWGPSSTYTVSPCRSGPVGPCLVFSAVTRGTVGRVLRVVDRGREWLVWSPPFGLTEDRGPWDTVGRGASCRRRGGPTEGVVDDLTGRSRFSEPCSFRYRCRRCP